MNINRVSSTNIYNNDHDRQPWPVFFFAASQNEIGAALYVGY